MITSRQMRSAIDTLPPKLVVEKVERVIIPRLAPIDIRVIQWTIFQIRTPRRIIRFLVWLLSKLARWYLMARTFGLALIGGKISDTEYKVRQTICGACSANEHDYCRSCGCWKWPPAKLKTKNRLCEWRCPEKQHPGRYIEWYNKKRRGSCYGNQQSQVGDNSTNTIITPRQTGANQNGNA